MSEYTDSDLRAEIYNLVNSRAFNAVVDQLLAVYTAQLIQVSSSDVTALVDQKRKIEALNDLIGTMRHINSEKTLEELNDSNKQYV